MKLLLIAPTFYPVHGGAGLRFYRYLPYFYQQGIETTVICGTPKTKKMTDEDFQADWQRFEDGELVSECVIESAKVIQYKIAGEGAKKRSSVLLNKTIERCRQELTKPDIVHIIAPMPFQVIKQLKSLKKLGVKVVYSHTIAKEFSSKALIKCFQEWKVKQVLNQYDQVLVQSESQKESLRYINKDLKIFIIPNGVDTDKFSPVENMQKKIELRESLGLPINATIITLVGAVHPRKGTDILIDAWSRLVSQYPNLNLVLIGPRYDLSRSELSDFKEKIERSIVKSKNSQNVFFLGQVDCVDSYLKASDMFVFPSAREGMPNSVLEAMASGLPVVLTPYIGISKEIGVPDQHFLLADRDSKSLCENILKIIKDDGLSSKLSLNARSWISANMSLEKSAKQHINIFQTD